MAESEHDPKVSSRYRELGREEPPPELDAAILAASRRAAKVHPAPLVAPTGRRRWYFPVAAAAIIVLAAAVTFHMDRQRPEPDMPVAAAPAPEPAKTPVIKRSEVERKASRAEAPKRERRTDDARKPAAYGFAPEPPAQTAQTQRPAPAPASSPAAADAAREVASVTQGSAGAAAARSEVRAARLMAQTESPERTLERIAELRRQSRHEEADKALAEFRKRYPDYKIPETMLQKVEKR
jgi:hypothetical protein